MTQAERATIVAACKYVDAVITDSPTYTTPEFMEKHGFAIYTFARASEQERKEKYKLHCLCAALPTDMIQKIGYTTGISTSDLVTHILKGAGSQVQNY